MPSSSADKTRPSALKARFLPAQLVRARASAMDPLNCLDLARPGRLSLYGILAFFDLRKPGEPVFASRETLLAESMLGSQATLYRGLADLELRGYIRREQGRRYARAVYGQYSVSRIWLSDKALQLLGLPMPARVPGFEPARDPDDLLWGELPAVRVEDGCKLMSEDQVLLEAEGVRFEESYPQGPSINVRDRLLMGGRTPTSQLSTREQPCSVRSQSEPTGGVGESEIDQQSRLPAELLPLRELGVSRARICLLMREARRAGNAGKLGTIVKLVWERIKTLRGRAVFAYLGTIVRQQKDFSRMLMIQGQPEDPAAIGGSDVRRLGDKLRDLLQRAAGMTVISRAGRALGILRRAGEDSGYVEGYDDAGVRRSMPVNLRMVKAWEEGELVIRPAVA